MRTFLTAVIVVSLFSGTAVSTGSSIATNKVVAAENVLDKLIALVKEYTNRVETTTSMEELEVTYHAFKQEMTNFTDKHTAEISSFDKNLSQEQLEKYKSALETAIKHFERSLEKKAMQFLDK